MTLACVLGSYLPYVDKLKIPRNHIIPLRVIRGGSRTAATSKMELFVMIVNGFQPLTIITKCSILDVCSSSRSVSISILFYEISVDKKSSTWGSENSEVFTWRCSTKKGVLKNSQNSQENTYIGISF